MYWHIKFELFYLVYIVIILSLQNIDQTSDVDIAEAHCETNIPVVQVHILYVLELPCGTHI